MSASTLLKFAGDASKVAIVFLAMGIPAVVVYTIGVRRGHLDGVEMRAKQDCYYVRTASERAPQDATLAELQAKVCR